MPSIGGNSRSDEVLEHTLSAEASNGRVDGYFEEFLS